MKRLLPLIFIAMLSACSDDAPTPKPQKKIADRTILVYMAGENNLSNYVTRDLFEMKVSSKELTERQQLIVYVDQAEANRSPYLARVKDGELCDTVFFKETSTADPAVMEKMLKEMRERYPANTYGLILWGHGTGVLISPDSIVYSKSRAYGGDTEDNTMYSAGKSWLNFPSMARAISNGMGSDHLSFIFGDLCFFSAVEIAYELRKLCDYTIGSPSEVPDKGAPYDLVIPKLFDTRSDYLHRAVDAYYDYYIDDYHNNPYTYYNIMTGDLDGYSLPLIVVKTTEMEALAQATANLLATIGENLTPQGEIDRTGVVNYAMIRNNQTFRNYAYDMKQVLKKNTADNAASKAAYDNWEKAFSQAIDYSRFSAKWFTAFSTLAYDMESFEADEADCGVLSFFLPLSDYDTTIPNWNITIQQYQWNDVIRWQQYGWHDFCN